MSDPAPITNSELGHFKAAVRDGFMIGDTVVLLSVFCELERLRAEVERMTDAAAIAQGIADTKIEMLSIDLNRIKSWQESVLAEVGPEPAWPLLTAEEDEWLEARTAHIEHHKRRAKHLAAKLVEAQSYEVVTKAALRELAFHAESCLSHAVSDMQRELTRMSIQRARLIFDPQSQPQPLQTPEPHYTEHDIMVFIGYLSADLPELAGVEIGRFHASWDEFCKRAGLPQRASQPLPGEPAHGGLTQCDMHDDESY